MAWYAWSKFETERNDAGIATKFIMPGEKITQDKLSVGDAEWEYLVETGAVREQEYPDIPDDVAPAEAARGRLGQSIVEATTHEVTSGELRSMAGVEAEAEGNKAPAKNDK